MSELIWAESGHRRFELGVDRGVFYPFGSPGVAWDGLISITENPSGAEVSTTFIEGQKVVSKIRSGEFRATLEAFTYPPEFEEYDGFSFVARNQLRKPFGLCYRTLLGNDLKGTDAGYLIHLVYNTLAAPSEQSFETQSEDIEPVNFSWELTTKPEIFPEGHIGAHLIIDSRIVYPEVLVELENMIYGTSSTEAFLPSPQQVYDLFDSHALLKIIDHGDGTWTAVGPDSAIQMLDSTSFQITWPSVIFLSEDTYQISSF